MKFLVMGAALMAVLTSVGAHAQKKDSGSLNLGRMTAGYSYFNRPGADIAAHNADVGTCLATAAQLRSFQDYLNGTSSSGIVGDLLGGLQAGSANRGVVSAALENCMVVRGWRVVRLEEGEGAVLAALPAATLAEKLEPWVGATAPHGEIARIWRNDAALGAVNHFSLHAQHLRNGHLSVLAYGTTIADALKADQKTKGKAAKPEKIAIDKKWPRGPLKPEALDAVPADAAIVIVNLKGMSDRQGNGFLFSRMGPDPDQPPSRADHATDMLNVARGTMAGSEARFLAFAVPAGRWRIGGMFNGTLTLSFCMGAPAFEVKPGEVVYAGALDLKQERLSPGMDMDALKAWMAGARAAERARPAAYVNGTLGACVGTSLYALEFDGMPFEDGYALGSKVPAVR